MKALIETLVANGHAYVAEGHVLFHVPSMPDYGKLLEPVARGDGGRRAGGRCALQARRRWTSCCGSPPSPASRRGPRLAVSTCRAGPAGTSNARPWRRSIWAKCSTSTAAASISCSRTTRTRSPRSAARTARRRWPTIWMHNGFLTASEGEKMSKSLGNFTTIHALRQLWPGEALRLALLSAQYRQPLPWSEKGDRRRAPHARPLVRADRGCRRRRATLRRRAGGARRRSQHAAGDRRAARACARRPPRARRPRPRA